MAFEIAASFTNFTGYLLIERKISKNKTEDVWKMARAISGGQEFSPKLGTLIIRAKFCVYALVTKSGGDAH